MLFDLLGVKEEARVTGMFWHEKIIEGLPAKALHQLAKMLDVTPADIAEFAGVPEELAAWPLRGHALDLSGSNAVYRLALAFQRAMLVFKAEDLCADWLRNPQKELAGNTPIRLLASQTGSEDVFVALEKLKANQKPKLEFARDEADVVSRIQAEDEEDESGSTSDVEDQEALTADED